MQTVHTNQYVYLLIDKMLCFYTQLCKVHQLIQIQIQIFKILNHFLFSNDSDSEFSDSDISDLE